MGTSPSTPTTPTIPSDPTDPTDPTGSISSTGPSTGRPAISADDAVRTLRRLRAEADASRADEPVTRLSLDADTFRRFVSTVRHTRPARPATHPMASMARLPDAVMAHRMQSCS